MRIQKSLFIVSSLAFSGYVAAQVPGWNVAWGVGAAAVPLSPWATTLLAVLISVAAFAFLRKRAHSGLMALAVAVLAGGLLAYSSDRLLAVITTLEYRLLTPSGADFFACETMNGMAGMASSANSDIAGPSHTVAEEIVIANANRVPVIINSRSYAQSGMAGMSGMTGMVGMAGMAGPTCEPGLVLQNSGQPGNKCTLSCTPG